MGCICTLLISSGHDCLLSDAANGLSVRAFAASETDSKVGEVLASRPVGAQYAPFLLIGACLLRHTGYGCKVNLHISREQWLPRLPSTAGTVLHNEMTDAKLRLPYSKQLNQVYVGRCRLVAGHRDMEHNIGASQFLWCGAFPVALESI